ncbi:serine hydrolase domain-containing protein [Luteibacter yeojuensis]|uniref:Serine hydrolase n=1 Tax=Luteibacter yeojuensis TaxID=345309 RepID=A0A7X5QSS0_9GAMM|nr:serine hydrolase [Luteibacter yeojuensis]NID14741.1 serine hydrolase [Luteibacter yeojuensis]
MAKKIYIAAGVALALSATAWHIVRPGQVMRIAAGVAAHHVCSMTFISGQDPKQTYDQLVAPVLGGFSRLFEVHVDRATHSVDVSSGPFTALAHADFTPGYGCRLSLPGTRPLVADTATHPQANDGFAPAGAVTAAQPAIAAAIDRVFTESPDQPVKHVKAVVIVKDGHVIAERYAPGFDLHTPLLSFSVAKSFTNAFLGVLSREGRIRVDQPLGAPEWQAADDPRRAITVENLMRMSSGLDAEEAESAFSPVARMEFFHADMAGFAARQPAKEAPGRTFEYTSADTVLLSRLVGEKVGGGPAGLRAFARREVFDRLGMGDVTMEFDGQGTFVGSTYVYTTARDYARFGMLYLRDGIAPDGQRLLPEGWVDWSRRSTVGGSPYGAGFWTNDGPSKPARWRVEAGFPKDGFYASGTMGQRIYVVPSEKLVIVRFGYSAPPDYGIEDDLALIKATIAATRTVKPSQVSPSPVRNIMRAS